MRGNETPPAMIAAQIEASRLDAGLYLVATPIGAARDITLRALDVLNSADLLAAEDTRTLRHLMAIHGIPLRGRRVLSYHDHNAARNKPAILAALAHGGSVAYCSDAGTPLVADPGFRLARETIEAGAKVHAVPGASAMLAALSVAGLPSDRFLFAGFPPQPQCARRSWLAELSQINATVIIFESPRRVKQTLGIICETDPKRIVVVCRELTKKFEETIRGTAREVAEAIPPEGVRGEVVLVLGPPTEVVPEQKDIESALRESLATMSVRDAAAEAAKTFGLSRREAYQLALTLGKEG